MTTRRGAFAVILGAVAAARLRPSPSYASIMPPLPVATVEIDELLQAAFVSAYENRVLYGDPSDPHPFEGLLIRKDHHGQDHAG